MAGARLPADRSQQTEAVLSLGLLAAGVAALAHGLIDASYALPDLMIVWVLILMAIDGAAGAQRCQLGSSISTVNLTSSTDSVVRRAAATCALGDPAYGQIFEMPSASVTLFISPVQI